MRRSETRLDLETEKKRNSSISTEKQEELNKKLLKAVSSNNYGEVLYFLRLGADANANNGRPALFKPSKLGYYEIVRALLQYGVDYNREDTLRDAANAGSCRIAELLLEWGTNALNESQDDIEAGRTALNAVARATSNTSHAQAKEQTLNAIMVSVALNKKQKPDDFIKLLKTLNMLSHQRSLDYISYETATLIAAMGVDADSPLAGTPEMQAVADFITRYNYLSRYEDVAVPQTLDHNPDLLIEIRDNIAQAIEAKLIRAKAQDIASRFAEPSGLTDAEARLIKAEANIEANAIVTDNLFLAVALAPDHPLAALATEVVPESKIEQIERLRNIHREIAARLHEGPPFFRTNVIIGILMTNPLFFKFLDLTARENPQQENPNLSALNPELVFDLENPNLSALNPELVFDLENPNLSALNPELVFAFKMWNKLKEEFEAQAEAEAIITLPSAAITLSADDAVLDVDRADTVRDQAETKAAKQETVVTFLAEAEPTAPSDQDPTQTRAATQADILMAAYLNSSEEERKNLFSYLAVFGEGEGLQVQSEKKEFLGKKLPDKYSFEEHYDDPVDAAAKNIKDFFHNGQIKEEYKDGFTPGSEDKYIALFAGGKKKLWPLSDNLSDGKISATNLRELYLIEDFFLIKNPVVAMLTDPEIKKLQEVIAYVTRSDAAIEEQLKLNRALLEAVASNNYERVLELLNRGADANAVVNTADADDKTNGMTALILAAASGYLEIAQLLLKRGADVNAADKKGMTALMWAARSNQMLQLLLRYGADVNAINDKGSTALMIIVATMNKENKILAIAALRTLVRHGAIIDLRNQSGMTASMIAAIKGKDAALKIFLESGADVTAADNDGKTVFNYIITSDNLSLEKKSEITSYIIRFFLLNGNYEKVLELLEQRADVNSVDYDGMTVLMWAAERGFIKIAEFLVENGAKLDIKKSGGDDIKNSGGDDIMGYKGNTALMIAIINGNIEIVKLLVKKGSDLNLADKFGMTAFMIATWYGHIEIIQFILEHGADINDVRSIRNKTELLLHKSEDDVNPSDKEMTALLLAAKSYHFGSEKKTEIINMIITFALFNQGQEERNPDAFVTLLRSGNLIDPRVLAYISYETATLIAAMGVDADSPLAGTPEMQAIAAFVINYNAHPLRQQNPANRIDQTVVKHLMASRDKIAETSSAASESGSGENQQETGDQISLAGILKANAAIANPALLATVLAAKKLVTENVTKGSAISDQPDTTLDSAVASDQPYITPDSAVAAVITKRLDSGQKAESAAR
jgi:ankyrin repeat protein